MNNCSAKALSRMKVSFLLLFRSQDLYGTVCLQVEKILKTKTGAGLVRIIDYACGAGHFLTEGFEAVSACVKANDGLRFFDLVCREQYFRD